MGSQVRVLLRPPWFPLEPRSSRGLFYFYFLAASQPISPTSKYSDMRALFISAATGVKPGSPKNRAASLEASRPYFSAIPLWPFADRGFPVFSPLSSIELYRVPESRANKRSPSQTPMPYSWGILCKRPDPQPMWKSPSKQSVHAVFSARTRFPPRLRCGKTRQISVRQAVLWKRAACLARAAFSKFKI